MVRHTRRDRGAPRADVRQRQLVGKEARLGRTCAREGTARSCAERGHWARQREDADGGYDNEMEGGGGGRRRGSQRSVGASSERVEEALGEAGGAVVRRGGSGRRGDAKALACACIVEARRRRRSARGREIGRQGRALAPGSPRSGAAVVGNRRRGTGEGRRGRGRWEREVAGDGADEGGDLCVGRGDGSKPVRGRNVVVVAWPDPDPDSGGRRGAKRGRGRVSER